MNPYVAGRLRDDRHEIEPARSNRPRRRNSGRGFQMSHAVIDVTVTIISFPEIMNGLGVHRCDGTKLEASRPLVIFATKIGNEDVQCKIAPSADRSIGRASFSTLSINTLRCRPLSRGSSTSSPSSAPSIALPSGELADRRPFSRSLTPSDTRTEIRL